MHLSSNNEFLCDCVEEGIDYIIDGTHRELVRILELINAIKSSDVTKMRKHLDDIYKNRFCIFDDGLYHLPGNPLQDLVQEVLDLAEDMCREEG